jgi:hypothetical protein
MNSKARLFLVLLPALLVPCVTGAQDTPRVRVSGVSAGQLVTLKNKIYAQVPPNSMGVQFSFAPESRGGEPVPPILLGTDRGHMETTFGPDCGDAPCRKRVFSVRLGRQLSTVPEGWGQLVVRDVGTGETGAVRVYWDQTPPRAKFTSPRFNAEPGRGNTYRVVARTPDEDIVAVKVTWKLAIDPGRDVPLFEQHFLGFDFAAHAACVPTAVGANLQWLQDTGQADVVNPIYDGDPKALVEALGLAMQTDSGGTSGAGARDGTAVFLAFTANLLPDQDYTLEHLGSGDADGTYGFTPQQMLEQLQAGGAVSLGFHNLASDSGFGHFLALTNVVLNPDGTARVVVMDPNVEPNPGGQTTGEYRSFTLHTNGKIDWTAANPGYYSPASGKVKLDELLITRDFPPAARPVAPPATLDDVPTSGQVPGRLSDDGHTFVGSFAPPEGSPGPWLLISESTHAAGHTQKSYRYVGGRVGTGPRE